MFEKELAMLIREEAERATSAVFEEITTANNGLIDEKMGNASRDFELWKALHLNHSEKLAEHLDAVEKLAAELAAALVDVQKHAERFSAARTDHKGPFKAGTIYRKGERVMRSGGNGARSAR